MKRKVVSGPEADGGVGPGYGLVNKNTEWLGGLDDQHYTWTYVNVFHAFSSFMLLHYNKGSPFWVPGDQGEYDLLTFWEQIDNGVQYTQNRKFFTVLLRYQYSMNALSHLIDYVCVLGVQSLDDLRLLPRSGRSDTNAISPITDIKVCKAKEIPKGYFPIRFGNDSDANLHSGGGPLRSAVYMCVSTTYIPGRNAITGIDIVRVDKKGVPQKMKPGYVALPAMMRDGSQNYSINSKLQVCLERDVSKPPVLDIQAVNFSRNDNIPFGYIMIDENVNAGSIGDKIFIAYKCVEGQLNTDAYEALLVDRYPVKDQKNCPLEIEGISMLCFSRGMILSDTPKQPTFVSFVVTQASGEELYGASIIFYENKKRFEIGNAEKGIHSITEDDEEKGDDDVSDMKISSDMYGDKKEYFLPKAICILSHYPFYDQFKHFLIQLHRTSMSTSIEQPLHSLSDDYIRALFHYTPPPRAGPFVTALDFAQESIVFSRPCEISFPLRAFSLNTLFSRLSLENIVTVFEYMLAEKKIVMYAQDSESLTFVAEALRTLLFPMHWSNVFIPILPQKLTYILKAPVPFFVGIHRSFLDEFRVDDDVLLVDLDKNHLRIPKVEDGRCHSIPTAGRGALIQELDQHLHEARVKARHLQELEQVLSGQDGDATPSKSQVILDEEAVCLTFVRFNTRLMGDFRRFYLSPGRDIVPVSTPQGEITSVGPIKEVGGGPDFNVMEERDLDHYYDVPAFVASRPPSYVQFYKQFTETQLFTHFVSQRAFSTSNLFNDMFFDACTALNRHQHLEKFAVTICPQVCIASDSAAGSFLNAKSIVAIRVLAKANIKEKKIASSSTSRIGSDIAPRLPTTTSSPANNSTFYKSVYCVMNANVNETSNTHSTEQSSTSTIPPFRLSLAAPLNQSDGKYQEQKSSHGPLPLSVHDNNYYGKKFLIAGDHTYEDNPIFKSFKWFSTVISQILISPPRPLQANTKTLLEHIMLHLLPTKAEFEVALHGASDICIRLCTLHILIYCTVCNPGAHHKAAQNMMACVYDCWLQLYMSFSLNERAPYVRLRRKMYQNQVDQQVKALSEDDQDADLQCNSDIAAELKCAEESLLNRDTYTLMCCLMQVYSAHCMGYKMISSNYELILLHAAQMGLWLHFHVLYQSMSSVLPIPSVSFFEQLAIILSQHQENRNAEIDISIALNGKQVNSKKEVSAISGGSSAGSTISSSCSISTVVQNIEYVCFDSIKGPRVFGAPVSMQTHAQCVECGTMLSGAEIWTGWITASDSVLAVAESFSTSPKTSGKHFTSKATTADACGKCNGSQSIGLNGVCGCATICPCSVCPNFKVFPQILVTLPKTETDQNCFWVPLMPSPVLSYALAFLLQSADKSTSRCSNLSPFVYNQDIDKPISRRPASQLFSDAFSSPIIYYNLLFHSLMRGPSHGLGQLPMGYLLANTKDMVTNRSNDNNNDLNAGLKMGIMNVAPEHQYISVCADGEPWILHSKLYSATVTPFKEFYMPKFGDSPEIDKILTQNIMIASKDEEKDQESTSEAVEAGTDVAEKTSMATSVMLQPSKAQPFSAKGPSPSSKDATTTAAKLYRTCEEILNARIKTTILPGSFSAVATSTPSKETWLLRQSLFRVLCHMRPSDMTMEAFYLEYMQVFGQLSAVEEKVATLTSYEKAAGLVNLQSNKEPTPALRDVLVPMIDSMPSYAYMDVLHMVLRKFGSSAMTMHKRELFVADLLVDDVADAVKKMELKEARFVFHHMKPAIKKMREIELFLGGDTNIKI